MSRQIPEIVKALENRIVDWDYTLGGILIHPKDTLFKELIIKYLPVSIGFEHKTQFICPIVITPEMDMDTTHCASYRALKGLECEIRWSGVARKNPKFVTCQELVDLRSYVPELKISHKLIDSLNSNPELVSLISSLRPDDLAVTLDSVSPSDMAYIRSREDLLECKAKFYQRPTKIIWLTIMSMMLLRRPGYQKRAENLIRILDLISHDVIHISGRPSNS